MLLFASTPFPVQAGLVSFILGDDAYAVMPVDSIQTTPTLGNMALLESNVSSASILEDKKPKNDAQKDTKSDSSTIDTSTSVNIVSDNALLPAVGPLGVYDGKDVIDPSFDQISVYVVRSGDTLGGVAEMFDVSTDTILSANDMKKGDKLKEGDVLLILPFSGIEHTVVKGQTLQGISNLYKVDINELLINNDIDLDTKLAIGDKLMIPGAALPEAGSKSTSSGTKSGISRSVPSQSSLKSVPGYFINPVPIAKKSRGTTSTHKGVDLAAVAGTPIFAAAEGRITFARNGYNGGFGNLVIISHPNGTETLYAHQSKILTTVGAQVAQGQIIGKVGNTGRSRGDHLHFEVHGAKNPGNDWSWKN